MARTLGEAVFKVRPDTSTFGPELRRGVDGKLRDANGRFAKEGHVAGQNYGRGIGRGASSGLLGVGKKMGRLLGLGIGAAVVGGGIALAGFLRGAVDEAREAQKVGALTAAVIKSTGGAAHVSRRQVENLSTALSNKVGIDDEVIQSGANMLLTFRNIRNEAGKGNDVFNQSTKTLIDMAAALGKDPKTAAIQLGKALNDPIKGITALGRAGVSFTDKQKETIKSLVESGDRLGAQKIILRELNKEFGGAAASQATAGEKAKVAWDNFKEEVGTAVLPVLDKLFGFLSRKGIPALTGLFHKITSGKGFIGGLADSLGSIPGRFSKAMGGSKGFRDSLHDMEPMFRFLKAAGKSALHFFIGSIPVVVALFKGWAKYIGFVGRTLISFWNDFARPVLKALIHTVAAATRAIGWLVRGMAVLAPPGVRGRLKALSSALLKNADDADHLARSLHRIKGPPKVHIETDAERTKRVIADLQSRINRLHGTDITISTTFRYVNKPKGPLPGSGGNFASGGLVRRGEPVTVGEFGREKFVPGEDGRIVTNDTLRRMERPDRTGTVRARRFDAASDGAAVAAAVARLFAGMKVRLVVGEEEFDAYLDGRAEDRIDAHRRFDETLSRR